VQELLARDLVDEVHVMVSPILLGGGKQLFADVRT
jgi:dihydrofolate reductase